MAVLVLNEVDKLSREAQYSLRRTMDKYSASCRLILCCNSSSKVTEAVRSRCLNVRVNAPSDEQVIEFVQFNERLQNSNHYLMAQLETSILQLKQKSDSVEEIEPILENLNYGIPLLELSNEEKLRALAFNEDLQTRPWWSPSSDVNYLSEPFDGASKHLIANPV